MIIAYGILLMSLLLFTLAIIESIKNTSKIQKYSGAFLINFLAVLISAQYIWG